MAYELIPASVQSFKASKRARKTIAFDGSAGNGAVGTVTLFTLSASGVVVIRELFAVCGTDFTGATATLALGVTGSTTTFCGAATATSITAAMICNGTTWVANAASINNAQLQDKAINVNIIGTVAVANITGGVLVVDVLYDAITDGATLT